MNLLPRVVLEDIIAVDKLLGVATLFVILHGFIPFVPLRKIVANLLGIIGGKYI